jgi:hypothetical protein
MHRTAVLSLLRQHAERTGDPQERAMTLETIRFVETERRGVSSVPAGRGT